MDQAHRVQLELNTPIRSRPRRILPAWEEEIARQVDEMCMNGICRSSNSLWEVMFSSCLSTDESVS